MFRFLLTLVVCLVSTFSKLSGDELTPNFTIMIPMRDGIELPTDIYLPSNSDFGKSPCVLLRSPAGRRSSPWRAFAALSQLDYVVAIQDTRSAADPEGKTIPYQSDGWGVHQDGYDTVEWLASSAFTNGKIGTVGFSALGLTQLMMAPSAPPSLKCQYIGVACGSLYHHGIFVGGQVLKNQVEGWLGLYARDPGVHSFVFNQPFYNEFWQEFDTLRVASKVIVPAVHYGGWYDTFIQGTIDAFVSRQENGGEGAKGKQKLLIGPWTHYWPATMKLGDFVVPKQAESPPIDLSVNRWLDFYLKGIDNGIDRLPAVTYYVMGPFDGAASSGNCWKTADKWPIPAVKTPFYLTDDQKLATSSAKGMQKSFNYLYDPNNPVPTVGGKNLFLESGPKDIRSIEQREDVVLFTSDPFDEDVEMTGQIFAKLYFSSDRLDTDVVIRLTDVYPDGRSILIADGIHRTGVCQSNKKNCEIFEVDIDLWSTSIVFAKGHRIRVSITSSNFPKFERNLNIGLIGSNSGEVLVAKNKLHVGGNTPSHIILPIVRRGETVLVKES